MSSGPAPLESTAVTDSRLAALCAQEAQQAFEKFQTGDPFHSLAGKNFPEQDHRAAVGDRHVGENKRATIIFVLT